MCSCGKQPVFNIPGSTTSLCCSLCKRDGMIDVINKMCPCGKHPVFNLPGSTKGIRCCLCKTDDMVDVKNKRCPCGKHPSFNVPGSTKAVCCFDCKTSDMVNVKNKICPCGGVRPIYNLPGSTHGLCCQKCKTDDMVNVVSKRCLCKKNIPSFNIPGSKIPIACSSCKTYEMIDVINKRCPGQDGRCTTTGNRKYRYYCTHCFKHQFPLDPLTFAMRSKSKEITVRVFINANFKEFHHDKPLWTSDCDCTHKRRIDHRTLINGTLLCIETDENQHKGYNKQDEIDRYNDIMVVHGGKAVFIRYNPDKYTDKYGNKRNPQIQTRLKALKEEIDKQITRIKNGENKDIIDIIKLFYDSQ
jgi:hypothetical protein